MLCSPIQTPDGEFTEWFSPAGLCRLDFPCSTRREPQGRTRVSETIPEAERWLELTRDALLAVLSGCNPKKLPPLDLSAGTDFQRRVWRALLKIPAGETRSYSDIARRLGVPGAMRAVGGGCGANPIPVLIPCHRVIAAGRKIGGFSGDMAWKTRLLEREGAWPLTKSKVEPELALK